MPERSRRRPPREPARDILAAEAFAMPAPDPGLRRVIGLPGDPAGIAEPHDILAAEEFAMPAPELQLVAHRVRQPAPPGRPRLSGARLVALWARLRQRA